MSDVPFGDKDDFAVVFYNRRLLTCVIIANAVTHIEDALAVVNSIKTQHTYIIAPLEAHDQIRNAVVCESMELYDYFK